MSGFLEQHYIEKYGYIINKWEQEKQNRLELQRDHY